MCARRWKRRYDSSFPTPIVADLLLSCLTGLYASSSRRIHIASSNGTIILRGSTCIHVIPRSTWEHDRAGCPRCSLRSFGHSSPSRQSLVPVILIILLHLICPLGDAQHSDPAVIIAWLTQYLLAGWIRSYHSRWRPSFKWASAVWMPGIRGDRSEV